MLIFVILLWGIASLMACWSFSLSVRWVSDLNARKRDRLVPMYSKRAFKLAPVLIFVCFAVAVIAGYLANQLASINGDYIGIFHSPVGIVSLLLTASGVLWIIRSVVGDRARGRVRCPKCWYDMSEVPTMMCPECGHESKSRSQHTRTKRPRWAFMIAILSLVIGSYGFSVNRRVIATDLFAAVPTWGLMAGWEWLPTHWIYDDGTMKPNGDSAAFESCLENRLDDKEWVSKERATRFAGRISKQMLKSKEARWDPKRLKLLASIYMQNQYWQPIESYPLPPSKIDHEELLRLCALDIAEALRANPPTMLDESILDAADNADQNAYLITRRSVLRNFAPKKSLYFSTYLGDPELNAYLQNVFVPIFADINQSEIVAMISAIDHDKKTLAIGLLNDSKAINQHYMNFTGSLDAKYGSRDDWENVFYFAQTLRTLPDELRSHANELIANWLRSDLVPERTFAIRTVTYLVSTNNRIPKDQQPYDVSLFMELVKEFSLGDNRLAYGPEYPDATIHTISLSLIIKHDRTGLVSFPLIGEMIERATFGAYRKPNAFFHEDEWTDESYQAWIDNLAQLAESPFTENQLWLLDNFPTREDTIFEDQLIEIAASLLHDQPEEIERKAREILWKRGIDLP